MTDGEISVLDPERSLPTQQKEAKGWVTFSLSLALLL